MKHQVRMRWNVSGCAAAAVTGALACVCNAAEPLVDYPFNETGTSAASVGSVADGLFLYNGSGVQPAPHAP